jgi:hypothetical protein
LRVLAAAIALAVALPGAALAQSAGREPTAEERQAAAEAYDHGTRSYLARDYARAAEWFETAYRMAPASAALIQAVRAHSRAGDEVRAATLALRLQALYGGERAAARQAEQTLEREARELVRVDVRCSGCTIELDGALADHPSFFVAAGSEHTVRATFPTGPVEQRVSGSAGETRTIELEAPPRTDPEPLPDAEPDAPVEPVAREQPDEPIDLRPAASNQGGIHPAVMIVGTVLTVAAGGVLVWSGIDTLDGVPAYEADPTPARLSDGQMRETRTNAMIGITAGLAAATLLVAIFTDWDGDPPADTAAVLVPLEGGAYLSIGGRL